MKSKKDIYREMIIFLENERPKDLHTQNEFSKDLYMWNKGEKDSYTEGMLKRLGYRERIAMPKKTYI